MSSLIMELGCNEILSAEMAVSLRNYIASRNPSLSSDLRARIFSDAVNRIVEGRMPKFGQDRAKRLKELLFRDITKKPVFSIDCADVFKATVGMKTLGCEFFRELNGWLSGVLEKEIAGESLFDFVIQTHRLMAERPEDDTADILQSAEQSTGGLKFAVPATGEIEYAKPESADGLKSAETPPPIEEAAEIYDDAANAQNAPLKEADQHDNTYEQDAGEEPERRFVSRVLGSISLSIKHRKLAAPAVMVATVLAVMLFTGFKWMAGSSPVSPADMDNPAPVIYTSAPGTVSETPAAGMPDAKPESIRMRATAYDLSKESCGKSPKHPLYGITCTGTRATVGRTVAVDPDVIPLGSRVSIRFPAEYSQLDGIYIAEDTGRLIKGDSIDIFFGEDKAGSRKVYESAMQFGVRYVDVKVLD